MSGILEAGTATAQLFSQPILTARHVHQHRGHETRAFHAVFEEAGKRIELRLDELSDGQRALLALYALVHLTADQGYTLLLDEPDNFVALAEIQPWLLTLADACGETVPQAILCSHHPELIDYLGGERGLLLQRETSGVVTARPLRAGEVESAARPEPSSSLSADSSRRNTPSRPTSTQRCCASTCAWPEKRSCSANGSSSTPAVCCTMPAGSSAVGVRVWSRYDELGSFRSGRAWFAWRLVDQSGPEPGPGDPQQEPALEPESERRFSGVVVLVRRTRFRLEGEDRAEKIQDRSTTGLATGPAVRNRTARPCQ